MRRRHLRRPHLEEVDAMAALRELPSTLRTGESCSDDLDLHGLGVARSRGLGVHLLRDHETPILRNLSSTARSPRTASPRPRGSRRTWTRTARCCAPAPRAAAWRAAAW